MKNSTLLCIASILVFSSTISFAHKSTDKPSSQPGDMLKALESLKSKGYLIVKEIEYKNDKDAFEAKVINADGKKIEISINPRSGEITTASGEKQGIAAVDIAKKVQDAGYSNIYKISTELFGNDYKVKAFNDKGEKMEIKLDVNSGNITDAEKD